MTSEINPAIGAMFENARDWLTHEHALFRSLNLDPILLGKGQATFAVDLPETFATAEGMIHGGLMTIIMDSIFGLTVFTALKEMIPIATINLRSDYISEAKAGERVICASKCIKIRNDVAFVTGDIKTQADNSLLATGSGTFIVGKRSLMKGSRL